MATTEVVLQGAVTADGQLVLDGKPDLAFVTADRRLAAFDDLSVVLVTVEACE